MIKTLQIVKIVSGGQTGADWGGLDAALELAVPHGGWCPKGRIAEDGTVPLKYRLTECSAKAYIANKILDFLKNILLFTQKAIHLLMYVEFFV